METILGERVLSSFDLRFGRGLKGDPLLPFPQNATDQLPEE